MDINTSDITRYILTLMATCIVFNQSAKQEEHLSASQIILLTIERSIAPSQPSPETILYKIQSPGGINRMLLKARLRRKTVEGVYATYMGWYTVSDYQGHITFPRKHTEPKIMLFITRSIQPILIEDNLVHHFIIDENEPAALYECTLIEKTKSGKPYWHIRKKELPHDKIIPPHAIVILAKPEHIHVAEGDFETIKSKNLILPTIYAREQLTLNINALNFADINRYFSPIEFAWRFSKARYAFIVAQ